MKSQGYFAEGWRAGYEAGVNAAKDLALALAQEQKTANRVWQACAMLGVEFCRLIDEARRR